MNIALIASGSLLNHKEATWITLHDLAKKYNAQGHYSIIIARAHPSKPRVEEVEGILIYRLYARKFLLKFWDAYRSLKHLQKKEKKSFHITHGFGASSFCALNTYLGGKAAHTPTIHSIKSYPQKYQALNAFATPFLRLVDKVTVPTQVMKKRYQQVKKIEVVRSNINIQKFRPRNKLMLKEKYGFAKKNLILYYGAIRQEKGVDCLIRSIPQVIREFPDAFFLLAIRSQAVAAKERYTSMIKNLGVQNNCKITLEDLPIEEYVSMADMVVLAYPTLDGTEGNPSCMLEAMASKTPVVTTDLPELREIVTPEKDVLMAQPGNPSSLSTHIKRLLENPLLRQKLAQNSYVKSKQFDGNLIAEKFLRLYEKILEEKKESLF